MIQTHSELFCLGGREGVSEKGMDLIHWQGSQHSGKTWEIRGKYGKVKKLGKTRETQGNLWENQKTQRKLSENFQLFDTAAVFSS